MCIEILKDFQRERRENPIFIHPLFSLPLLIQSYDLSYDSKTNTGHNNMNTQKMKCKSMQYPCSKYYFREEFSVLMSVRQVFTLRCFCLPDCVHVILSTTYVNMCPDIKWIRPQIFTCVSFCLSAVKNIVKHSYWLSLFQHKLCFLKAFEWALNKMNIEGFKLLFLQEENQHWIKEQFWLII